MELGLVEGRGTRTARRREQAVSASDVDGELLERAKAGESAAQNAILRACRGDVARIAHRYLGPSSDVEDVVQEALLQVHRSLPRFEGKSRFSTWLYRLVANVAKMHLRAKASRPKLAAVGAQEAPRPDDRMLAQDQAAIRSRRVDGLYGLLEGLSDKKREVLVMHDFEGMTPTHIASVVDAPVMTVRTRLFYARKELYLRMAEVPELRDLAADLQRPARKKAASEGGE